MPDPRLLSAKRNIFHGFPVFFHDGKVEVPGPFAPDFCFPVTILGAFVEDSVFSGLQLYTAVKRGAVAQIAGQLYGFRCLICNLLRAS